MPLESKMKSLLKTYKANRAFRNDFDRFSEDSKRNGSRFEISWEDRYPCLDDRHSAMPFDPHYIYHTAWAARLVAQTAPALHVDISSLLYFSTIISAFVPVEFYDYRPAGVELDRFSSKHADLLSLPFKSGSVSSISCMHVVEHVGLGRYGDHLDPDGDLKAMDELKRILAVNGSLLFVVPVGRPKIMFNAHRIYSHEMITDAFSELELAEFSLIPDDTKSGMIRNASKEMADAQTYGCGCFWFMRK